MAETDTRRLWLVDRESRDNRLIALVYATPDGAYSVTRERSVRLLEARPATAAVDVAPGELRAVDDADTSERYATEASRMADRHDPDDEV